MPNLTNRRGAIGQFLATAGTASLLIEDKSSGQAVSAAVSADAGLQYDAQTYLMAKPFEPRNRGIHGRNKSTVIKAAPNFPAAMERANSNGIGLASFPAAVLAPKREAGIQGRNELADFTIDGDGRAPTCLYLGLGSDITAKRLHLMNASGSPLVLDAIQNSRVEQVRCANSEAPALIVNGAANTAFVQFNILDLKNGLVRILGHQSYPGYAMFRDTTAPRQITFERCIWERAAGRPKVLVYVEDARQIIWRDQELTFGIKGGGDASAMEAMVSWVKTSGNRWEGGTIVGDKDDFPAHMSVFDIDGRDRYEAEAYIGGSLMVRHFNAHGTSIRSVIRHRNGAPPLTVDGLEIDSSVNAAMLIESDAGERVTYLPPVRQGEWSERPTKWIDANCEFLSTSTNRRYTKSGTRHLQSIISASAPAGTAIIEVSAAVMSQTLVGDQIRLALDDGRFHVATVVGSTARGIQLSQVLEGSASSGAEIVYAGRWYDCMGQPYFG